MGVPPGRSGKRFTGITKWQKSIDGLVGFAQNWAPALSFLGLCLFREATLLDVAEPRRVLGLHSSSSSFSFFFFARRLFLGAASDFSAALPPFL